MLLVLHIHEVLCFACKYIIPRNLDAFSHLISFFSFFHFFKIKSTYRTRSGKRRWGGGGGGGGARSGYPVCSGWVGKKSVNDKSFSKMYYPNDVSSLKFYFKLILVINNFML